MSTAYETLFAKRGSAYDHAMQRHPRARSQEFIQAIAAGQITSGMVVADVPAGGGYLQDFLPAGCTWLGHEPCIAFNHHSRQGLVPQSLLPLPWTEESVDVAISLAGIHHMDDKRPLFAEFYRVVKPMGRLVISDVARHSSVAGFLDGYVGTHNSTGHDGVFLDDTTLDDLAATGWSTIRCKVSNFHWQFSSRAELANFCHQLFDITKATVDQTQAAIESELGVTSLPNGEVGMQWSLMTIVATRP